jgi:PadR family transcriptional regulator, regulatory protein AphA
MVEVNAMNTLGYAILSALDRKPCSGYQLVDYLEVLWPAKHSQIYPLLTKMEQKGLLVYKYVEQIGRPGKKVFSITDTGKETLDKWVVESPTDPIIRDEFLIKMYSVWLTDEDNAKKLVQDRISILEQKVTSREKKIVKMEKEQESKGLDNVSKDFGRYILYSRRNLLDKEEISWCNWVLNLVKKKTSETFDRPSFHLSEK